MPSALLDSLTLLSVVQEQQAELQTTEIRSDTRAYTDTMLSIVHLSDFQFSPSLDDIGGARFWRVDSNADYRALAASASTLGSEMQGRGRITARPLIELPLPYAHF